MVAPERRHLTGGGDIDGFAWVEVMGQARANSRPLARYLALINVAAVIAALGVIKSSSILIVGAMAVSPDLLPICATCVGIVAGRRGLALARRSLTLTLGPGPGRRHRRGADRGAEGASTCCRPASRSTTAASAPSPTPTTRPC